LPVVVLIGFNALRLICADVAQIKGHTLIKIFVLAWKKKLTMLFPSFIFPANCRLCHLLNKICNGTSTIALEWLQLDYGSESFS